jgi:hypothetical protein
MVLLAKWDVSICARTPATVAGRFVSGIPIHQPQWSDTMANDIATDFSGILGKLGAGPGGGLFGGKIADQPILPPADQPAAAPPGILLTNKPRLPVSPSARRSMLSLTASQR